MVGKQSGYWNKAEKLGWIPNLGFISTLNCVRTIKTFYDPGITLVIAALSLCGRSFWVFRIARSASHYLLQLLCESPENTRWIISLILLDSFEDGGRRTSSFFSVCGFPSPSCNRDDGNWSASSEAFRSFCRVWNRILWCSLIRLSTRKRPDR